MKKIASPILIVFAIVLFATAQQKTGRERLPVYLSATCEANATGAVVESSLRESIRSSTGYVLAEKKDPGIFLITLACVDAGNEGEGWTAVAYHYGLLVGANPEKIGIALWNPALGVFTVGRGKAQSKGQEFFARFDNDVHRGQ